MWRWTCPTVHWTCPTRHWTGPTCHWTCPTGRWTVPTWCWTGPTCHWTCPTVHWTCPTHHWTGPTRHWTCPTRHWTCPTRCWTGPTVHWTCPTRHWTGPTRHWTGPTRRWKRLPAWVFRFREDEKRGACAMHAPPGRRTTCTGLRGGGGDRALRRRGRLLFPRPAAERLHAELDQLLVPVAIVLLDEDLHQRRQLRPLAHEGPKPLGNLLLAGLQRRLLHREPSDIPQHPLQGYARELELRRFSGV